MDFSMQADATTGDVYALRREGSTITGYSGPLHYAEAVQLRDRLDDVEYETNPATLTALNATAWCPPVPREGAAQWSGWARSGGQPVDRATRADLVTARDTLLGAASGTEPAGPALTAAAAMLDGVLRALCQHEPDQWHRAPDDAGRIRTTCWACDVSWYEHGDEHSADAARQETTRRAREGTRVAREAALKREDEESA